MKVGRSDLALLPMTEIEATAERRRLGYWLRLARETAGDDGKGVNQAEAARAIGLSGNSGSAISDLEHGLRDAKQRELTQLANYYDVPPETFWQPRPTDQEWLADQKASLRAEPGKEADAATG